MEKIILDTNFLLIPAQFKVDIYSEIEKLADFRYELNILDKSIDELNKIAQEQKGKVKRDVKLVLSMVEQKIRQGKISIIDTPGDDRLVDDIIVSLEKDIVATQDIGLQKRLKAKKVKIISMRQKKYLFFK
ncbi:MAG: nucleotide-binding protein [Nanoarchaeota archaeon]|nr:nucleotide-binding protein [Nanoarchaeota archaeon]